MIVYYLGAGASYGTFPLYAEMSSYINAANMKIKSEMDFEKLSQALGSNKELSINWAQFSHDIEYLVKELPEYETIDTFFNTLVARNSLERMKLLFETLMYYWQLTRTRNKRYTSLIAKYVNVNSKGNAVLNRPLTIISWNYDLEIERALAHTLNVKISQLDYILNKDFEKHDASKINLYKVNGSLSENTLTNIDTSINPETSAAKYYCENFYNKPNLKFAWENHIDTEFLNGLNIRIIRKAEALVAIGYSFPTFNSSVDAQILDGFGGQVILQCTDDLTKLNNDSIFIEKQNFIQLLGFTDFQIKTYLRVYGDLSSFPIPILKKDNFTWTL